MLFHLLCNFNECQGREIAFVISYSTLYFFFCIGCRRQFPFLCIHQLFLSYHFAFGFVSLPSHFVFLFFFYLNTFQSFHNQFKMLTCVSSIVFALVLPSMLWTFVNYYIFIAIQFDSVIYGFSTYFRFTFFSYFFTFRSNRQTKPFCHLLFSSFLLATFHLASL